MDAEKLKQILEAALLAADEPLSVERLLKLFAEEELDPATARDRVRDALGALETESAGRGYELMRVASGYRYQVRQELSPWVSRLWEEKPPRYSRALLETLALVAYKQPVTRGDIEDVRGVAVSQSILRTLTERGWVRVVGQREVPGRPSLYGTTRGFLDYFNLKSLDQLPPLAEIRSLIEPLLIDDDLHPSVSSGAGAAEAGDTVAEDEGAPLDGDVPEAVSGERSAADDRDEDASGEDYVDDELLGTIAEPAVPEDRPVAAATSAPEASGAEVAGAEAGESKATTAGEQSEGRRTAQVVPLPTPSQH